MDFLLPILKKFVPDLAIVQRKKCGRTTSTNLIQNVIAKAGNKTLIETLRKHFLYHRWSNGLNNNKIAGHYCGNYYKKQGRPIEFFFTSSSYQRHGWAAEKFRFRRNVEGQYPHHAHYRLCVGQLCYNDSTMLLWRLDGWWWKMMPYVCWNNGHLFFYLWRTTPTTENNRPIKSTVGYSA